jgi:hypothetical protein
MSARRSRARWSLALALACLAVLPAAGRVLTSESDLRDVGGVTTSVSFDQFRVGFLPDTSLQLGGVAVRLTKAGSAPIFGPGAFGIGFTTNFLSTGVQDGGNNVVLTFPAGTIAAGAKLVSAYPVTVTAVYATGVEEATFRASDVAFLGFAESAALQGFQRIMVSSAYDPAQTPIVNVGDITYAMGQPNSLVFVPTLTSAGMALLVLGLALAGGRSVAERRRTPRRPKRR